jgi:hypothetical protein
MFLRQKHAPLRAVLEELAAIVIKTTLSAVHETASVGSVVEQERRFDDLSGEMSEFVEGLANKPSREQDRGVQAESEVAKLLLARLSW